MLSIDDVVAQLEITRLIHLYAERVDLGDYEGVAELFRDAGMSAEGSDHVDRGYDAVYRRYVDWTRRLDDNGTPHTKHVTTNVVVDVDHAAGTADVALVLHGLPADGRAAAAADHRRPLPRPLRARRRRLALRPPPHGPRPVRRSP